MSSRRAVRAVAAIAILATLTACGNSQERQNVRPPAPGIPSEISQVTGIYRTVHQAVLQLRATGDFNLIVPGFGATSGTFTLDDGTVLVSTDKCGNDIGNYRLQVTGEQLPDKAALVFEAVEDPCEDRRRFLTIDPWVYAVS